MVRERLRRPGRIAAIIKYAEWLHNDQSAVQKAKTEIEESQKCQGEGGGGFIFVFHNLVVEPHTARFWFEQSYKEGLSTSLMWLIGADIKQREQNGEVVPEEIRSNFEGFFTELVLF